MNHAGTGHRAAAARPGLLLRLDSTQVEVDPEAEDADWAPEADEAEEAERLVAAAIAEDCWTFPMPKGPAGRFIPWSFAFYAVWEFGQNKSAAKDLVRHLQERDQVRERCESDPSWFLTGPLEGRPAKGQFVETTPDQLPPRPKVTEQAFELFAYDEQAEMFSLENPH